MAILGSVDGSTMFCTLELQTTDAHDDNVGFVVHLEDVGFGHFKLCDATACKDDVWCRGFGKF